MARKVKQRQLEIPEESSPDVDSVTELVEISVWVGTYRERMRVARTEDQAELANTLRRWNDRWLQRRAELA
jgi:hypothetical protein